MKNEDIAKVCHEVNRAYCQSIGDDSQVPWKEASEPIQKSALMGVEFHLANDKTPEESHNSWMENKIAEGWVYGEEKNEEIKTHPCMISYSELPAEQKAKDFLFKAVVKSMSEVVTSEPVPVPEGKTPIKYIGKRERYTDGAYATHITFVKGDAQMETQMVPEDIARKMLKHADVYTLGEIEGAGTPEVVEPATDDNDNEEDVQDVRDSVSAMQSKKAVMAFAETNFSGMKMDPTSKLADLKQQALGFIDQYGIN